MVNILYVYFTVMQLLQRLVAIASNQESGSRPMFFETINSWETESKKVEGGKKNFSVNSCYIIISCNRHPCYIHLFSFIHRCKQLNPNGNCTKNSQQNQTK